MTRISTPRLIPPLAAAVLVAIGCDSTGPTPRHRVELRLAAAMVPSALSVAAGQLQLTSFRIVAGEAALGSRDEFGCIDCQGSTSEQERAPRIVDVPLRGGAVTLETGEVAAGSYPEAEISVVAPTAATLVGVSGWPAGATIEVAGSFAGAAFRLTLAIEGTFREQLVPPVEVPGGASAVAVPVTITLPVATWFTANGTTLDPNDAAQRALIEANARRSFGSPETEGGGER